ncbi:unnamed protein product, partial [Allacma fusca]
IKSLGCDDLTAGCLYFPFETYNNNDSTLSKKSIDGMMKQYAEMHCDWGEESCAIMTKPSETFDVKKVVTTTYQTNIFVLDSEKAGKDFVQYGPIQFDDGESHSVKHKKRPTKSKRRNTAEASVFLKCGPSPEITLQHVLSKICPPKQWRSRGLLLRQNVSNKIPTRKDVLALKEKAANEFRAYKSIITEDGLCKLRREMNGKIFDELIRQVAVKCLERGHQLIKIRDEYYYQFESYEKVFYSLIAYSIRKNLISKNNSCELREKIGELQDQIFELERINSEFPQAMEFIENKFEQEQIIDDNIYIEEFEKARSLNRQLKNLLLLKS